MAKYSFEGSGTFIDPYLVYTAEDLDNTRNFQGVHFKQMADIDLSAYSNWIPIGGYGVWECSYDGRNHTISNLNSVNALTESIEGLNHGGLFGDVNLGRILDRGYLKRIRLRNVNVNSPGRAGALAAAVTSGTIEGCSVEGGKVSTDASVLGTGGLVGDSFGPFLSRCWSDVEVNAPDSQYVGGLIGQSRSSAHNCFAKGKVVGSLYVGGLMGFSNLEDQQSVKYCYGSGDVTAQNTASGFIATVGTIISEGISLYSSVFALNKTINRTVDASFADEFGRLYGDELFHGLKDSYALNTLTLYNVQAGADQPFYFHDGLDITEEQASSQQIYEDAGFDFESVWYLDKKDKRPKLNFVPNPAYVYQCETLDYPPRLTRMMINSK